MIGEQRQHSKKAGFAPAFFAFLVWWISKSTNRLKRTLVCTAAPDPVA
jgi:hypothetical protein